MQHILGSEQPIPTSREASSEMIGAPARRDNEPGLGQSIGARMLGVKDASHGSDRLLPAARELEHVPLRWESEHALAFCPTPRRGIVCRGRPALCDLDREQPASPHHAEDQHDEDHHTECGENLFDEETETEGDQPPNGNDDAVDDEQLHERTPLALLRLRGGLRMRIWHPRAARNRAAQGG
jgi:hypothetical protein